MKRGSDEEQMIVDSEGRDGLEEQMDGSPVTAPASRFPGIMLLVTDSSPLASGCVYLSFEFHSLSSISIGSKVVFNKASVCVPQIRCGIRGHLLPDCITGRTDESMFSRLSLALISFPL